MCESGHACVRLCEICVDSPTKLGTTGTAKAAVISHVNVRLGALVPRAMFGIRTEDVLYTALPLYHSAGGVVATSIMMSGTTLVIRDRRVDQCPVAGMTGIRAPDPLQLKVV